MAKSTLENPRQLLDFVLNLIARDIKSIYDLSQKGKLHHEVSNDLVRYSGALLAIIKDIDIQSEAQRKALGKLSMKDLMEKAEVALKNLKEADFEPQSKP